MMATTTTTTSSSSGEKDTYHYQHTVPLSIKRWTQIAEPVTYQPYQQKPVLTFDVDQYFQKYITRNQHLIKVRLRQTNGRYDGDHWAMCWPTGNVQTKSKEYAVMLFTIWEGYPFLSENGTIAPLPLYERDDCPYLIKQFLVTMQDVIRSDTTKKPIEL
jgi:hypothetical protein